MDDFKGDELLEVRIQDPEGDVNTIYGETISNWDEFINNFVKQSIDMPPRDSNLFPNALEEYMHSMDIYIRSIMLKPPDENFITRTPLIAKLISAMLYDYSDECKYQAINAISITLEKIPDSIQVLHGNAFTQSIVYVLPTINLMKPESLYVKFAQLLIRLLVLICANDEFLSECVELGYNEIIFNLLEDEKEMISCADSELLEAHYGVVNECFQFLSMAYRNQNIGIEWDYNDIAPEFANYLNNSMFEERAMIALLPLTKIEEFATKFNEYNGFEILWERISSMTYQTGLSMVTALQIFQTHFNAIPDNEWSMKLYEIMSKNLGQDEEYVSVVNESLRLFIVMLENDFDVIDNVLVLIFDLCSGIIEIEPMVAQRNAAKLLFLLCRKYGIDSLSSPEIAIASALNTLSDNPEMFEFILDVIIESCMHFIGNESFTEELKDFIDEAGEIDGLEEKVNIIDQAIQEQIGE